MFCLAYFSPGPNAPPEIKKMAQEAHGCILVNIGGCGHAGMGLKSLVHVVGLKLGELKTHAGNCARVLSSLGSSLISILYDAWTTCSGEWSKSTFYMNVRSRHLSRTRGVRKWLTALEMDERFGCDLAQQIRDRKNNDTELKAKETRAHPELPDSEARMLTSLLHSLILLYILG